MSDSLVFKDIEGLESVSVRSEEFEKLACELALRLLRSTLNEDKELRLLINQVFNFPESLLSLFFEPLRVELLLLFHYLSESFWTRVLDLVWESLMRVEE